MIRPGFFWKLSYPYLILLVFSLAAFAFFFVKTIHDYEIDKTIELQKGTTVAVKEELNFSQLSIDKIEPQLQKLDKLTGTRITVIKTDGTVIGDSRQDPYIMDTHIDRPEITEALKGQTGYSVRFSHTLNTDMVYVAVPLYNSENILTAVLRTAIPINILYFRFSNIYPALIGGGLIIAILASLIGVFISRQIGTPLLEMRNAAKRFSVGDFSQKILPSKDKELKSLADSLNSMAAQLDGKINEISEQKNFRLAILESMKEGVIAVDYAEHILFINKTAEQLLSIEDTSFKGKSLQEVIRVSDLHKFFRKIVNEGRADETEIMVQHETDKIIQLSGTMLHDTENKNIGVLVVLNDITNLKHLDTLKRDLVANVSHELKTPVTTIKGFIETLREGAIREPQSAERFLEIVYKNTERLNAIIEDLLSLSHLEQASDIEDVSFNEENICEILHTSLESHNHRAGEKDIEIKIQCENGQTVKVNKLLLEQAVSNLADNAIKYSSNHTKIIICSSIVDGQLKISVKDEGYGISKEHIPRLFERFYRVDKSRSRDEGGTGLGLAIVKHIAQLHHGTVEVESTPGKGSTFTLIIPA